MTPNCRECFNANSKRRRDADEGLRAKQAAVDKARRESDPEFRLRKIEVARIWYAENRERHKAYGSAYQKRPDVVERNRIRKAKWNTSDRGREYFAERQRRIRQTEDGKVITAARRLLSRCLEITSSPKTCRTFEALGYTKEQLVGRISCQFAEGMSWLNHGEWHIDHKKPVSAFISQGVTDPKTINSLCNLQPLWAAENLAKSDKWVLAHNDNSKEAVAA